jgi:hypothetical protein
MNSNTQALTAWCFKLAGSQYGEIPKDYPLQVGAVVKVAAHSAPPENVWNQDEANWVRLVWLTVEDPSMAVSR